MGLLLTCCLAAFVVSPLESPGVLTALANNPHISEDCRHFCVRQLLFRHARPGMKMSELGRLLDLPAWLQSWDLEARIDQPGTVFRLYRAGEWGTQSETILIRASGYSDSERFFDHFKNWDQAPVADWAVQTVAYFCDPTPTPKAEKERAPDNSGPGYVKVEIKGILLADGEPETDWEKVYEHQARTGLWIYAPGRRPKWDLYFGGWDPATYGGLFQGIPPDEPPGEPWNLFIGESKELQEAAKRLVGRTVVAEGYIAFTREPSGNLGGWAAPPMTVVKVMSLKSTGDTRDRNLAALQGCWKRVSRAKGDEGDTDSVRLRVKGEEVYLRNLRVGSWEVCMNIVHLGEARGTKFISLSLLGKAESIAYSVDEDKLVFAGGRTLFGKEKISLWGEWVRVKPDER